MLTPGTHTHSGDSYTSIDFSPSGAQPNASNPIGNPAFPGVDTDNGLNWVGYLISTLNDSLVLAYDFAVAGATVDSDIVPQYEPSVRDFVQQVTEFQNHYADSEGTLWNSSNSLFTSWFGINDIVTGYAPANWSTTANETVARYFAQVQLLHDAGARSFVVFLVPPFWRAPKYLDANATTEQDAVRGAIADLNERYLARLAQFEADNADATFWTLNTTTVFDLALDDPTAYGAPDATCYSGDGTSCLWFNDLHPGQAIQNLVAEAVKNVTAS